MSTLLPIETLFSAGAADALPAADQDRARAALLRQLGVPESPAGYSIRCDHGLFTADDEINGRLHAAGFTPEQAQLLYDLAAERFLPLVQEISAGFEAERELRRLVEFFGGDDKWREVSRQITTWAKRSLPTEAVDGLARTADGVIALYRLMGQDQREPAPLREGAGGPARLGEREVHAMIRDPRYWRDRDPDFVARVSAGFRQLYPGA